MVTSKAPTRDEKQAEFIENFLKLGGKAYVEACTGFGKTRIALMISSRLKHKKPTARINVVVPTLVLQKQWRDEIEILGFKDVEVWVINSYVRNKHACDLLILDEGHRFTSSTAQEFSQALDRTDYTFVCALSATFSEEEKKFMYNREIYCAGVVTLEEARKNGWVNDFIVYNLPIDLTPDEKESYDKWNDIFSSYFGKFGHDWNTAMSCMTIKPIIKKDPTNGTWMCWAPDSVHWCKSMGWTGNSPQVAMENYFYNQKKESRGKKRSVWGNDDHTWSPTSVNRYAAMWHRSMQMRNKIINTSQAKLDACISLINRLQVKTITFSESIEFADLLTEQMPDISRSYHSSIKSERRQYTKITKYKTKPDKVEYKTKPVSGKFILQETKQLFKDDKLLVINTARALDEGFDTKGLVLGIETSGSSNPRQKIQRTGRVVRKEELKELAVYVRIYAKGTHEEGKVRAQQKGMTGIIVVNSINDIHIGRAQNPIGSFIKQD
jgi:superfamily II DNA or RNA helicase